MASGEPARAHEPTSNDPSMLVGLVIADRYRVDAVLGQGGMGAVLRCRHLGLDRDVAVKLLHPDLAANPEIAARFDREAQSASRLDHPNCVHVFDFGAWQPTPGRPVAKYLAMQLLAGCELTELLGQPLAARRAIALADQILAGLEHAHDHGIVHRDLKPENVFVTVDHSGAEVLKLVDFGIAKITAGDGAAANLTRMGMVFGTPRYMSPEQAAGGVVDLRADLYTFGVIFYEMLCGVVPFVDDDMMELLRMHLFADPAPLPDSVPPGLRAITMKLLQKERGDRFASATEVRTALTRVDAELAEVGEQVARALTIAGHSLDGSSPIRTLSRQRLGDDEAKSARPWHRWAPWAVGAAVIVAAIALAAGTPDEPEAVAHASDLPAWWPVAAEVDAKTAEPGDVAVASSPLPLAAVPDRVDDDQIIGVDAMIARAELASALGRIDALLGEHADDPRLHVRRARVLARVGDRDAEAIAALGEALERDPDLLGDRDVNAELLTLLRKPELRRQATVLAIDRLGDKGIEVLIEFVHAPTPVLPWGDRHRALAAIEAVPGQREAIDRPLQLALDLWQAEQAEEPCVAFAETLAAIERDPHPAVLGSLARATPPRAAEDADDASRGRCAALPARALEVRETVLRAYPTPAEQWTVPPAYEARVEKTKPQKKAPKPKKKQPQQEKPRDFFRRIFR